MTLRLGRGGSQMSFAASVKCCVQMCGSTREENRSLPFYSFPSDPALCNEWLKKIRVDDEASKCPEKLHTTHMVCWKHFTVNKSGMSLNVEYDDGGGPESTGAQAHDKDWMSALKEEFGVEIIDGDDAQCSVCASIWDQPLPVYEELDKQLNWETLMNHMSSINVQSTDTEPLNICTQCVLTLKEFTDLHNITSKTNECFSSSNSSSPAINSNTNLPNLEKSTNSETISLIDSKNDKDNSNEKESLNECQNIDKSKLNVNSSSINVINKDTRKKIIKIMMEKSKNDISMINDHDTQSSSNTDKVIHVEFTAEYLICHGKEWVYEIKIEVDQLKHFEGSDNQIFEIIVSAMRKQCMEKNSKILPLSTFPSCSDGMFTLSSNQQEIQTESVLIEGKNYMKIMINNEIADMLEKNKPLVKTLVCQKCGLQIDDAQSLNTHIKSCFSKSCPSCGELFESWKNLMVHKKVHNNGFVCHSCGSHFKTFKSLNFHCKRHRIKDRHCCSMCNLQFNKGFELRKHLRQCHKKLINKKKPEDVQKKKQKCSKCELWFSKKLALSEHMRTHLPKEERTKTCPDCKKVFINAREFAMHLQTHVPRLVKCPECPCSFPNEEHLNNHIKCHKITEPVYCDICQQVFKTTGSLKKHITSVHQDDKYVQKTCAFCNLIFHTKEELKTHINNHTYEEKAKAFVGDEHGKLQCNECNKYFLFKSRLAKHIMYYHNSPCAHCGKHTEYLTYHYCKKKNRTVLKYRCSLCTKRFPSCHELSTHERTHEINYPFQCTVCSRRYSKMFALKSHRQSHNNIHVCSMCGLTYKNLYLLKKHMKKCTENNNVGDYDPDQINNSIKLSVINNPSIPNHSIPLTAIPIVIPIKDENGYFISATSLTNIPHLVGVPIIGHNLQAVDISDFQNLYVE